SGRACAGARARTGPLAGGQSLRRRFDGCAPERLDQVWTFEESCRLGGSAAVAHVRILEDVCERPSPVVLADDVGGDPLLLARLGEEERERAAQQTPDPDHGTTIVSLRHASLVRGRALRGAGGRRF